MSGDPRLAPLGELLHLGLITVEEHDDALAELEIVELQRADNAAEGIAVPELAQGATAVQALAWMLCEQLIDEPRFFAMLPEADKYPLASAALQLANRQAVDMLYDENVIDQWQRDNAHERLPSDRLAATPVAAMRHMLAQGTLSAQQLEAIALRVRANGTQLARLIVGGVERQTRRRRLPQWRPSTWISIAIVLIALLLAWLDRGTPARPSTPTASSAAADSAVDSSVQQRAAAMVETARLPGASGVQYQVEVVQEPAPASAP